MAKLVFDIETSALPLENFDEVQQEYLLREAGKNSRRSRRATHAARKSCGSSISGRSPRRSFASPCSTPRPQRGQVLFTAEDFEEDAAEGGPVEFVPCADELELLTAFWDVAKHYDEIVTFNGRGFDVPFLYLRSALLNVPISKQELARLSFCHRAALRSRRAIHLLRCQRTRRRGAQVQPGFLLQGVRHRFAQKPRRDRHGRQYADGRGQVSRDRRILPARCARHGGTLPGVEGTTGGNQVRAAEVVRGMNRARLLRHSKKRPRRSRNRAGGQSRRFPFSSPAWAAKTPGGPCSNA